MALALALAFNVFICSSVLCLTAGLMIMNSGDFAAVMAGLGVMKHDTVSNVNAIVMMVPQRRGGNRRLCWGFECCMLKQRFVHVCRMP